MFENQLTYNFFKNDTRPSSQLVNKQKTKTNQIGSHKPM